MSFVAAPEMPEDEDDKLLVQPRDADGQGGTADGHVDTRLQTNLASARLQSRLLKTERDARTFIEEQGVNILYLALGMLRWYEAKSSQEPRRAPLILVPVALERSSVRERFRLRYTEEEIEQNLPLVNKLRVEFGVDFPEMLPQEELDGRR